MTLTHTWTWAATGPGSTVSLAAIAASCRRLRRSRPSSLTRRRRPAWISRSASSPCWAQPAGRRRPWRRRYPRARAVAVGENVADRPRTSSSLNGASAPSQARRIRRIPAPSDAGRRGLGTGVSGAKPASSCAARSVRAGSSVALSPRSAVHSRSMANRGGCPGSRRWSDTGGDVRLARRRETSRVAGPDRLWGVKPRTPARVASWWASTPAKVSCVCGPAVSPYSRT